MKLSLQLLLMTAMVISSGSCIRSPEQEPLYFPLPDRDLEVVQSQAQAFMVDTVLTGLNRPWSMEFLEDNRVLITERDGIIRVVDNGVLSDAPVQGDVPFGLRDIKLHPRYSENGWIYLSYYTEKDSRGGTYSILMRGRLDENEFIDGEILYTAGPFRTGGAWTGGRIVFDRDGYLYYAVGIRGDRYNAQDLSHQSGKIMRLNDDGSVPPDNPFRDSTGVLPEIYSYGHREHQGMALHPSTGESWSTEHGEFGGDELNRIEAGANFGWPLATYSLEYDGSVISEDPLLEGTTPPEYYWATTIGPSGLDFVTGDRYPGWRGDLFTGSLVQRMLNRTVVEGGRPAGDEKLLDHIGRVRTVRFAPDGYLYLITEDTGLMVRLLPAD